MRQERCAQPEKTSARRAPEGPREGARAMAWAPPPYGVALADRARGTGQRLAVQASYRVSRPGDALEREADQVAARVVSGAALEKERGISGGEVSAARECASCAAGGPCTGCQEDLTIHRKEAGTGPDTLDAGALAQLGPGAPLDAGTRSWFEPRFQEDFGAVRVHADGPAAQLAQQLDARALTVGQHVIFGAGEYAPSTPGGQYLLAHELTHVVQQRGGAPSAQRLVRSSSVTCPAAATGIASPHVGPADRRASALLTAALARIDSAVANHAASPAHPDVVAVGDAMRRVFHLDPAIEDHWSGPAPAVRMPVIRRRLAIALSYIDSVVFTVNCIPNGGAGFTIPGCLNSTCSSGTEAFSCHDNPTSMVLCPDFWALGLDQRARTYMHEVMHINFGFVEDWGQPSVHNAHCYAQFVALLNGFDSPAGFRCTP